MQKFASTVRAGFFTAIVGFICPQMTSAMDLVIAIDDNDRSLLQTALTSRTADDWNVAAYQGTDIELVDEIRLRAVRSDLPEAAQIPGATIRRYAALGFINDIESVSGQGEWQSRLPEQIYKRIGFQDKVYAVPTQIHRSNWMWLNRDSVVNPQLESTGFVPPRTWKTFFELAQKQQAKNQPFLVVVDDPAQNTLILESLVLGLAGPDFYRGAFEEFDYKVLRSEKMIEVYQVLAKLRPLLNGPKHATWEEGAHALNDGRGTVFFAGDWVKPAFMNAEGKFPFDRIACEPYPEAAATFLFNLNSVVMFKDTDRTPAEKLANALFTDTMLSDMNIREGSIPALLDISPYGFDECGVRAMREFRSSHTINTLQPSLAAGMAAAEVVQKGVFDAVNEFVSNQDQTPEQGARELAKAIRVALYKI